MTNRQQKRRHSAQEQLARKMRHSRVALQAMRVVNQTGKFTPCLGGCGRLVLTTQGECRRCRKHRVRAGLHRVLGKGSGPDPRKRHG